MNDQRIQGIEPDLNRTAVRLYGEDDNGMDDFPVLKAFQQYIDAEQAKARKRIVSLGIFFGILMGAVIAVFVVMLVGISQRNQQLNDRLIEYAMKDRDRLTQSPVVVQPPVQQDGSAILALTTKLDEMQKKLLESQESLVKAERERAAAVTAAEAAAKPKAPSPEEQEIARLKALLQAERDKNDAEKEKKKAEELENYRRTHYPELYEKPLPRPRVVPAAKRRSVKETTEDDDVLDDLDDILNDKGAISYFDDDDEPRVKKGQKKVKAAPELKSPSKHQQPQQEKAAPSKKPAEPATSVEKKSEPKKYQIPVEVKGSTSSWRLP